MWFKNKQLISRSTAIPLKDLGKVIVRTFLLSNITLSLHTVIVVSSTFINVLNYMEY